MLKNNSTRICANDNAVKRRRGGQPGNRNAVGNSGGAPRGNKNGFKHGAYERLAPETMSADEREIFEDESAGSDVERELRQTLAALNAKEVRLLKRIAEIKGTSKGTQMIAATRKRDAVTAPLENWAQLMYNILRRQIIIREVVQIWREL